MRFDRHSPSDRRGEQGLTFWPEQGVLALGGHTVALRSGWDNQTVLAAFVDLAGKCRGEHLSAIVEVRQADMDALAQVLDLDADGLASELETALGSSREEAAKLVARLKEVRLIGGIAAAATGAAMAGAIVLGTMGGGSPAPQATPAKVSQAAMRAQTTTTTEGSPTPAPEPAAITETPDGVGLVPAIQQDADGTGLIAPATTEQTPPN